MALRYALRYLSFGTFFFFSMNFVQLSKMRLFLAFAAFPSPSFPLTSIPPCTELNVKQPKKNGGRGDQPVAGVDKPERPRPSRQLPSLLYPSGTCATECAHGIVFDG